MKPSGLAARVQILFLPQQICTGLCLEQMPSDTERVTARFAVFEGSC
jgi:hypothetical protein